MPTIRALPPELEARILAQATNVRSVRADAIESPKPSPSPPPPSHGARSGTTAAKRKNKFNSEPVFRTPDGQYVGRDFPGPKTKAFDSRAEYRRWISLRGQQAAGLISGLTLQKTFLLRGLKGRIVCRYRADFVYIVRGVRVVEDVKSRATKTRLYLVKKKLMEDNYGITITEFME